MSERVAFQCLLARSAAGVEALTFIQVRVMADLIVAALAADTAPPVSSEHLEEVRQYLQSRAPEEIELGTVTLGIAGHELVESELPARLLVAETVRLRIIDGQHRLAALVGQPRARKESKLRRGLLNRFGDRSLAVRFLLDRSDEELDQAVADAGRTQQMPPGLLAPFDRADPISGATIELIERSVLHGLVDRRAPTLQRRGRSLFVFSSVRAFVAELAAESEQEAHRLLSSPAVREGVIELGTELLGTLAELMPPWIEVTDRASEISGDRMAQLRQEYVNLTGAALITIGHVARVVARDVGPEGRRSKWVELARLDWRRDSSLWEPLRADGEVRLGATGHRLQGMAKLLLDRLQ